MPFTPVTFTDGVTPLNKATFDALQAGVIAAERTENKNAASGYVGLDASSRIVLGGDTNLYRYAANLLATDAQFYASVGLQQVGIGTVGPGGLAGLQFSASADVSLYRAAAGVLKTNGSLAHMGYGTTLPASPVDGQLFTLVDSTTNPTYQWQFRYNAGSSSAYKWEFVGGAPLINEVATANGISNTGYNTAVGGPTLTLARPGEYIVTQSAYIEAALTAGWRGRMSFWAQDAEAIVASGTGSAGAGAEGASVERTVRRTLNAQTYITGYRSDTGGTVTFSSRSVCMTPVRVS